MFHLIPNYSYKLEVWPQFVLDMVQEILKLNF